MQGTRNGFNAERENRGPATSFGDVIKAASNKGRRETPGNKEDQNLHSLNNNNSKSNRHNSKIKG